MTRDQIILKRCRTQPREVIAFILDAPANPGMILSYMHVGQHGEASLGFMRECRPVNPGEKDAAALLRELRTIGYKPALRRRLPRHWRAPA